MLGNSPDTTFWWSNVSEVPGSDKGNFASGYQTLYDRLRVASAAATVYFPIYNYATNLGVPKPILGTYLAFDNDGMFHAFSGCKPLDGLLHMARSSKANRAAEIAPELCPEGKYGYDPRCRDWYATGKRQYLESGKPVHITSPYTFQIAQTVIASSATAPIGNPKTGDYAGQVLLDYYSLGLLSSMEEVEQSLSFVITPSEGITGGDTVISPNKTDDFIAVPIEDVLFPPTEDPPTEGMTYDDYRRAFQEDVLTRMKSGETDIIRGTFLDKEGNLDAYYMAFAPVTYRLLAPLDPTDFAAGVNVTTDITYSVAIGESISNIKAPFYDVQDKTTEDLFTLRSTFVAVVALVTLFYIIFIVVVTLLVTKLILTLLDIVQDINTGIFNEDILPLISGCRESEQVYSIFSRLNKIIRVSNTAFFSHNVDRANHFLNTAVRLFKKIDDEKAIGVTSNNLANTLFVKLYDAHQNGEPHTCGGRFCKVQEAILLYNEAVAICQKQFDRASVVDRPMYAERLSDRLFNRGLFSVFCSQFNCSPEDAKAQGHEDIERAKRLHFEIADFLLGEKLLFGQASGYWSRLLRRIDCLLAFYHDEELRQLWDAETLLDEADQLMMAAWGIPTAPLFHEVTGIGRRQQLEGRAILLCLVTGQEEQAFHLSLRMFAQDEYLIDAFIPAAETLLLIGKGNEKAVSAQLQEELQKLLKNKSRSSIESLTMEKF